jgi:repressor LexA
MYYNEPRKTLKERMEETDHQILQAIKTLIRKEKHAPSVREITKAAGMKSTSTTFAYLQRLQKKGLIDWQPQSWRTLHIIDENKTSSAG